MSSGVKECDGGVFSCTCECAMAQCWPAPASKVPWVVREPSNQALKDSRLFKEVLCSEDKQKSDTNLRLYSLINDTFFPFYLPERYHSMDCVAIKNITKVEGHYWAHASYFLLSNQLHGILFWKSTATLTSNRDPTELHQLLLPLLTRKKKSEMFQDGLEQCKTSAEFLLNPWVLMQLPWNPVLLLQWTAAYLTEYYLLNSEMVEFYRWNLPLMPSRVVSKLLDLLASMNFYAFKALFHIKMHADCNSRADSFEHAGPFLTYLIHEVVPLLEFVTSGKARNIVRALKRLSFGSNFNMLDARKILKGHYEWEDTYTCMFSSHFWSRGDYDKLIGSSLTGSTGNLATRSGCIVNLSGSENFRETATPQWIAQMETKYGKKFESRKILNALEPMISQGAITNVSNEDLLKGIEFSQTYFLHCYYRLMELKAIIDGGLRDEDAGVLYDVLYTRTKYRIADVQCAMLQKLAHFCYANVTPTVKLNALNAQGPEMSLSHISKMIQEATERKKIKKTSCWKELKKRVPLYSRSKVKLYEECPNLAVEGALKVADKFEDRIKRMVFNVLEDHESWTTNEIKIHPEQQIVQYILPCFVASMLEFASNDDVEIKYKHNYVRIVHELIKDLELHPYKVACMCGPFAGGFSPYFMVDISFLKSVAGCQVELIGRGLQTALGPSRKAKSLSEILDKNFFSVLLDFENTSCLNYPREYTVQRILWQIQVHNLFGRILRAIEAAVPGSLPNLMALEMSMIANICFADHANKFVDRSSVTDPVLDPIFQQLCLVTKFRAWKNIGAKSQLTLDLDSIKDHPNFQQCIIWKECLKLSLEQITALIVFYSVQRLEGKRTHEIDGEFRVPMDITEEIYFAYHAGDQVKLKLLLGKMFTRSGINFSEVTYEFAKKSAPLVYLIALARVHDNRVQMKEPCELSLIPFKHCRWCGLVQNDVLKLCEECKADRRFPYRTWFCSDECQRLAMDKVHREEHVRHLLLSIGIEDVKARDELKTDDEAKKKKKRRSNKKRTCPH